MLGVLQRHESLAANLGAKLIAPLLLKSFEKLFEGPIKVTTSYGIETATISWLDVVEFARSKPSDFVLSDHHGGRVCQFWLKQCMVEISEDDYRLVLSGAPERMIPTQPIVDDEMAELGTMDILEQRLALLIKRADLVAARARQLNYHLKGRRSAITSRLPSVTHNLEPGQPSSTTGFFPPSSLSATGPENRGIHQDLLRQFISDGRRTNTSRSKSINADTAASPRSTDSPLLDGHRRAAPIATTSGPEDGSGGLFRSLITSRIEKLNRNDPIWPSCDRCRRLRMDCTKYLTACAGCTKKHAKCTWRDLADEEISYLMQAPELSTEAGEVTPDPLDINANLDPGLRPSVDARTNGEVLGDMADGKRPGVLSDEHAMLTQMASAAAAQGNR